MGELRDGLNVFAAEEVAHDRELMAARSRLTSLAKEAVDLLSTMEFGHTLFADIIRLPNDLEETGGDSAASILNERMRDGARVRALQLDPPRPETEWDTAMFGKALCEDGELLVLDGIAPRLNPGYNCVNLGMVKTVAFSPLMRSRFSTRSTQARKGAQRWLDEYSLNERTYFGWSRSLVAVGEVDHISTQLLDQLRWCKERES